MVSAVLSPRGPGGDLFGRALRGELQLVLTRGLLDEAERTIGAVVAPEVGESIAAILRDVCELTAVGEAPQVARDPDDDHVIAAAVAAGVRYVVTGDHDLLALNRKELGVTFIEPARMLELLGYL